MKFRAAVSTTLELQLCRTILTIASHHLARPWHATGYFNLSPLEDSSRGNGNVMTRVP